MSSGRCMRPGPITSNGYLNFLREFRKKCCGMTAVQTVKVGAKAWNKLTCAQKAKYRLMGCKGAGRSKRRKKPRGRGGGCRKKKPKRRRSCRPKKPKRKRSGGGCKKRPKRRPKRSARRKGGCGGRKKPRRRPRPRSRGGCKRGGKGRRSGKQRKRCMKSGPVTANAYLNFLRLYRRKHCGLKPQEAVKKGARKWCSLKPECRKRFERQACQMSKSQRKKRSRLCRSFKPKRSKRSKSRKRRC